MRLRRSEEPHLRPSDRVRFPSIDAFQADGRLPDGSPLVFAGGVFPVPAGKRAVVDLDLAPGRYLLICDVTDPETEQDHDELGMTATVEVR